MMPRSKSSGGTCKHGSCRSCRSDRFFLRRKSRPQKATMGSAIRAVDLFAGCGGMSLGLEEAARRASRPLEISLAADLDADAIAVYKANFPHAHTDSADIASLFDGEISASPTVDERRIQKRTGKIDVLLGGPPCQGHSGLNNHTRRDDPKNALYLRMARAAEVLEPKVIVIENVAGVELDKRRVVKATSEALAEAGYQVAGRVVDLRRVGAPQRRRRFILLASKLSELDPVTTLDQLATSMPDHPDRSVRWAIEDLARADSDSTYDTASRSNKVNSERIAYLFENRLHDLPNSERPECHQGDDHTYLSMYGRLHWDRPAQTITTGFGSMGQGRYVHPSRPRTITPHEAARLQTFPDWFDFGEETRRGTLATLIGNAVPPLLMIALGSRIVRALSDAAAVPERKRA